MLLLPISFRLLQSCLPPVYPPALGPEPDCLRWPRWPHSQHLFLYPPVPALCLPFHTLLSLPSGMSSLLPPLLRVIRQPSPSGTVRHPSLSDAPFSVPPVCSFRIFVSFGAASVNKACPDSWTCPVSGVHSHGNTPSALAAACKEMLELLPHLPQHLILSDSFHLC